MKFKTWQISVTLVCLISGILFAINLRSLNKIEYNPVSQRNENLVNTIRTQEKSNKLLENEVAGVRKRLENYQHSLTEGSGRLAQLQQDIETAKKSAGLSRLEGPGIVITLDDKKDEAEEAMKSGLTNLQPFLIHDEDLHSIVNDLKVAGAEAISVNGLRIVSTSDIKCAGYLIQVSGTRLAAPYTIKAIGNPDHLEEQVRKGNYLILEWGKFPVKLSKESSVTIAPYKGSFIFRHAKIAKKAGEK